MSNPNAEDDDFTDSLIDQTVRRCKFCKKIGHVRRSHSDCDQNISRIRTEIVTETSEIIPEVEPQTAASIPEVVVPEIIGSIPDAVAQLSLDVTCRFCGLEGHERATHHSCLANPVRT
ncbi:hypothetical protein BD770DRAFT_134690, partial [Pilaira anomala]